MKTGLLNRKQLPDFGVLGGKRVDIPELIAFCHEKGYLDPEVYNDGRASSNSAMKDFLYANEYCKNTFFKEALAESLEGTKYRQLYLTTMDDAKRKGPVEVEHRSMKHRLRRLDPDRPEYLPEADERNLGVLTGKVEGPIKKVLDMFKAPFARVRFAYLAPGFQVKPHIDYDPSYVTRYHIPMITNDKCIVCVNRKDEVRTVNFAADGRIYFLNTGHKHWVENNSDQWRLHLIIDVQNQDDLDTLVPI